MSNHHRSLVHDHRIPLQDFDLFFMAASPIVSHCHHFNLFFDQIVDDALGWEVGREVRAESAYEAGSQLLNAFILDLPPTTIDERLDLASSIFAGMGLGTLEFDISRDSGVVIGRHLHYGSCWRREHGTQRNRSHPADAVASGFIAAAVEAAYGLPFGSVLCTETRCTASSDAEYCEFEVVDSGESGEVFGVTESDILEVLPPPVSGLNEDRIRDLTTELREFVLAVMADKRGAIENFGVHLTHHLANYYNHCSNRMLAILAEEKPAALEVAKELLRESGQRDGYFMFGGIFGSAEWEALVASFRGQPQVIVDGCVAMARALGFGRWCVEAYEPDQKLVLVSPGTYESAYHKVAFPDAKNGCCYAYQGAAVATMDLAHAVDWHQDGPISQANYQALRAAGTWTVAEPQCLAAGDDVCRVVVQRG